MSSKLNSTLPAFSALPSIESATSYSFSAILLAPTLIWMLIWGGCDCGPSEAGAFGFSNDRSLVYCARTLSWGGAPAPEGLPLPLVMGFFSWKGGRVGASGYHSAGAFDKDGRRRLGAHERAG